MPAPARIEVLPLPQGSQANASVGEKLFLSFGVGCAPFGNSGATIDGLARSLFKGWVSTSYRNPALTVKFGRKRQVSVTYPESRALRCVSSGVPGIRTPFLLPMLMLTIVVFKISAGLCDAG